MAGLLLVSNRFSTSVLRWRSLAKSSFSLSFSVCESLRVPLRDASGRTCMYDARRSHILILLCVYLFLLRA